MEQDVVIALVQKGNEFVFMQRTEGAWTFPSGKVELDEPLNQASKREVKEETGLLVGEGVYLGTREMDGRNFFYHLHQFSSGQLSITEPKNFQRSEWMSADKIFEITKGRLFAPVADYLSRYLSSKPTLDIK